MDRLLTGLQPSGNLTIGNYSGGIKQVINYQNNYETFLFVPDMHATTVTQDPELLHKNIRSAVGVYLACGVDVTKPNMHVYIQSENLYHANLSWLLECHTYYGELSRMHQFKEKSKLHENFTCGLFTYPVLMAADILLYDAKYVPTGIDQKQHVELARNIAERFNNRYKDDYFVVPEPVIPSIGAKIRDLQDPTKKMSKSTANPKASVFLLDPPNVIKKKIMGAQTDSEARIAFDEENKPGVSNLLTIYSVFAEMPIEAVVAKFEGGGYGDLKKGLVEVLSEKLTVIQDNYNKIMTSGIIDDALDAGRDFTEKIAKEKYETIRKVVGYGRI
ncbi:MAG: tryptophan--tRNA ligase [Ruminococcaceae bacterium]|nr:tryptophan--tRNA ligase [Oscillospiraceae bacterium]